MLFASIFFTSFFYLNAEFKESWKSEFQALAHSFGNKDQESIDEDILEMQRVKENFLLKSLAIQVSLTETKRRDYLVLKRIFEHRSKELNILDDVTLVLSSDVSCMNYAPGLRAIFINPDDLSEWSLESKVHALLHEFTHLEQHMRYGLTEFLQKFYNNNPRKDLEDEADKKAFSLLCLSCRDDVQRGMALLCERYGHETMRPKEHYSSLEEFSQDSVRAINARCLCCEFKK
jgi:hypothetical protein